MRSSDPGRGASGTLVNLAEFGPKLCCLATMLFTSTVLGCRPARFSMTYTLTLQDSPLNCLPTHLQSSGLSKNLDKGLNGPHLGPSGRRSPISSCASLPFQPKRSKTSTRDAAQGLLFRIFAGGSLHKWRTTKVHGAVLLDTC